MVFAGEGFNKHYSTFLIISIVEQYCGDFLLQMLLNSGRLNKWIIHSTWFKGEKNVNEKISARGKRKISWRRGILSGALKDE